jgi:hypothetical protein
MIECLDDRMRRQVNVVTSGKDPGSWGGTRGEFLCISLFVEFLPVGFLFFLFSHRAGLYADME